MPSYHHQPVGELAHQLKLSPVRLRRRQLDAAEHVADLIDDDKSYPYDFVCHHITGHRPAKTSRYRPMLGKSLLSDLALLIEELSAAAPLPVGILRHCCWTTEELAGRLNVSTKTINRWRKRGLPGRKLRYPDGTVRMAFTERSVRRFVTKHHDLVKRGAAFTQLSKKEKEQIVALAREILADRRIRLHELSQDIATQIGRAVETVRYTIRRYDQANPETALFGKDDQPLVQPELHEIYKAVEAGCSIRDAGRRFNKPVAVIRKILLEVRARLLAGKEIEYIFNVEFDAPGADDAILADAPHASETKRRMVTPPRGLPAH